MPKHPNTLCVSSEPKYPELLFGIMGSLGQALMLCKCLDKLNCLYWNRMIYKA